MRTIKLTTPGSRVLLRPRAFADPAHMTVGSRGEPDKWLGPPAASARVDQPTRSIMSRWGSSSSNRSGTEPSIPRPRTPVFWRAGLGTVNLVAPGVCRPPHLRAQRRGNHLRVVGDRVSIRLFVSDTPIGPVRAAYGQEQLEPDALRTCAGPHPSRRTKDGNRPVVATGKKNEGDNLRTMASSLSLTN